MNIVVNTDTEYGVISTETVSTVRVQDLSSIYSESSASTAVVTESTDTVCVTDNNQSILVLSYGGQGPQGIQGESSNTIPMIAGSNLNGHIAVSTNSFGKVIAPTLIEDTTVILGIITSAYSADDVVSVQITGTITEPSWNWTLGLPIFVGPNGTLTQTPPSTGVLQIIAYPILSNRILIDKQQPITIG